MNNGSSAVTFPLIICKFGLTSHDTLMTGYYHNIIYISTIIYIYTEELHTVEPVNVETCK